MKAVKIDMKATFKLLLHIKFPPQTLKHYLNERKSTLPIKKDILFNLCIHLLTISMFLTYFFLLVLYSLFNKHKPIFYCCEYLRLL
jgi:hypothetical protein